MSRMTFDPPEAWRFCHMTSVMLRHPYISGVDRAVRIYNIIAALYRPSLRAVAPKTVISFDTSFDIVRTFLNCNRFTKFM